MPRLYGRRVVAYRRVQGRVGLREYFERGGYMRVPDPARRKPGSRIYKKGYEMRFVVETEGELREVQKLLRTAGVKMGRPYPKHSRLVQPVYGKAAVVFLCYRLGIDPPATTPTPRRSASRTPHASRRHPSRTKRTTDSTTCL